MKNNKTAIMFALMGTVIAIAYSVGVSSNIIKEYQIGDYVPEAKGYLAATATSESSRIKANKYITPTDSYYNTQKSYSHGSNMIGDIESVWNTYTGKGTKIAVIDDGFKYDHPEFKRADGTSAILEESMYFYMDYYGTNVYQLSYKDDPDNIAQEWNDEYGEWDTHGTNTASTAAAPMNNSGGVGIAPEADILALKIDMTFGAIETAIDYAIAQDVDVINMSLGAYGETFTDPFGYTNEGYSDVPNLLESVCQKAYDAGIIVVAAAGNEATSRKSYPACNYGVIGVGALEDNDEDTLAYFSNYVDPNQTGEINVDILAPGYVFTAGQGGSSEYSSTNTYFETRGTSFSSPMVAGAAALWKQKNPNGTPAEFLNKLQSSASDQGAYANKYINVSNSKQVGPSNIQAGRLNVGELLDINEPHVEIVQTNIDITVNETKQVNLKNVNGTVSYKIENENIATVNTTGKVKGVNTGETTLTVTAALSSKTVTASIPVIVRDMVATTSMSINPTSISIEVDKTYDILPTITTVPSYASHAFLYESDNVEVATVDIDTGVVTAVKEGTAEIYIMDPYGEGEATLIVNVTPKAVVTGYSKITSTSELTDGDYLIVCEDKNNIFDGALTTLDAVGNNKSVTISNDNITSSGSIDAAKFTISSINGGYAIKSSSGYYIGNTTSSNKIESSTTTQYLNEITFSSGNAIITGSGGKVLQFNNVDDQQRFRYLTSSASNCFNIQLYKSSSSGSGSVTPPVGTTVPVTGVTLSPSSLTLNAGDIETLTATVAPNNATNKNVTWSSNNGCVSVNNGEITANNAGFAVISVTTEDGGHIATCDVTVNNTVTPPTQELSNYTIDFKVGSGDGTEMSTSTDESNYISSGAEYVSSIASVSKTYAAGSSGLKLGASSSQGKLTLNIEQEYQNEVASIVVNAKLYNSSKSATLSVNEKTAQTVASSFTDYTFEINSNISSISLTSSKYLWVSSITVNMKEVTPEVEKVVESISATYSGSSIYKNGTLDASKVSVVASYTEDCYEDETLNASDYTLSSFSSDTIGTKTITVTYVGSLNTSISPLTCSFTVEVIEDSLKTVTVTNSKTYHPGDKISKNDITVTVTYLSGSSTNVSDFTFDNDGYMFTYEDAPSGGSNQTKTFNISYLGNTYSFSVNVSREQYIEPQSSTLNINGTAAQTGGVTGTDASSAKNYTNININGVTCNLENAYTYVASGTRYISFGKTAGKIYNTVALDKRISDFEVVLRSGSRSDYDAYVSEDGNNWIEISSADYSNSDYRYFKMEYLTSSSSYSNFNLKLSLADVETVKNLVNYLMYEDTANQCVDKLNKALIIFNSLSNEDKEIFMTSNDHVTFKARERLLAWASNQGIKIMSSNGTYVINKSDSSFNIFDAKNDSLILIVFIFSSICISGYSINHYLKKRER